MADYIFPDFISKALRKPNERTQMEASLVGITFMIISSLGIAIYFMFFTDMSIWFKILLGLGELGVMSFQLSLLVTTYIQYYTLKMTLGLYPIDIKLNMKIIEAQQLIEELNSIIKSKEVKKC